jgi:glycerol-3-phosphate dehydrogenase
VNLSQDQSGKPLDSSYTLGFEYADCWVDDARLVVLNARDAADHGAQIHTRTEVIGAYQEDGFWHVTTRDTNDKTHSFSARVLINASGPWAYETSQELFGTTRAYKPRLVRGSHIVVPRLYEHDRCYILQNADGRIVFVIPYEETLTLIGTTERDHGADLENVSIENDEIVYLCESVSNYFKEPIGPGDVVWSYSALRPLFDDGSSEAKSITRDYRIVTESDNGTPPMISILGGKITTYRTLAEEVMQEIGRFIPVTKSSWTGQSALPGGDFPHDEYHQQVENLRRDYPFLDLRYVGRLTRLYGTLSRQILHDAKSYADLGRRFGSDLYEAEVRYLVEKEWAVSAEDILWRRTKEGLRVSDEEVSTLERYVAGMISRIRV